MPNRDQIDALPEIGVDEVRVGDLLFFIRKGELQDLFWSIGDIWVHTALTIESGGALRTGEVGTAPQIFSRSLPEVVDAFDLTVIGRLDLPSSCLTAASDWVGDQVGKPQDYDWENFLLAGLVVLTRRGLSSNALGNLGAAMQKVFEGSGDFGDQYRTCASFVYEAFERLGPDCAIPIRMADQSRFGSFESLGPATGRSIPLSEMRDMEPQQQDEILGVTSLYELQAAERQMGAALEGIGESRVTEDDVAGIVEKLFKIAEEFYKRPDQNQVGHLPSPLVSPTDLWFSDKINYKARVSKA